MRRFAAPIAVALLLVSALPASAVVFRTATPDTSIDPCSADRPIPMGWEIRPLHPTAGDSVSIVFMSCRDCVDLLEFVSTDSIHVSIHARSPRICPLTLVCRPDSLILPLGRLAAGHFMFAFDVRDDIVSNDTLLCTIVKHNRFEFEIGSGIPPLPGFLPFVTSVRIGPSGPCLECPPRICPHDSIPVFVTGIFPSSCFKLRRIDVLPPRLYDPTGLVPPIVRLIVDDFACSKLVCMGGEFPFSGRVTLPPQPGGTYELELQEARVSCSDSVRAGDSIYVAHLPFVVADRCSSGVADCLLPEFEHPSTGICDASVSRGHPAVVIFDVSSTVALSGLQGNFSLSPAGLHVENLETVGQAVGMHLEWRKSDGGGARFVMFADRGAPIGREGVDSLGNVFPDAVPVLRVTVAEDPEAHVGPVTFLRAWGLLGADINGASVPECPMRDDARFAAIAARICSGVPCDFNGDGVTDVRDLVTMVHCVLHTGPCPDSTVDFDCNHDGHLSIDDVLCCAGTILRGGGEDDSLPGRSEPGITLSFGEPVRTESGVDVMMHLNGASRIGAARLALDYPRDRFDVSAVELKSDATSWLALHEVTSECLAVGLIGMGAGGTQSASEELDLVVHLSLKSGQQVGGELKLGKSQFSGPDGAKLKVELGSPALSIGGPAQLSLSRAIPNPFTGETRFAVSVTRGADVEVAIHDLSGRRVATLYHGHLEAGSHAFVWNGTREGGARAADGLYFYRVRAGGKVSSGKAILLRGN